MDLLVEMELVVSRWDISTLSKSCLRAFSLKKYNLLYSCVSLNRESGVTLDLLVPLELPVPLVPLDLLDPLASKETEEKL